MCGIAGWAGRPADPEALARMVSTLAHRGPDARALWAGGPAALGMQRLAIVDLKTGSQPYGAAGDRLRCVYNGETYNFRALRDALEARGHRFSGQADGEVIPHLYLEDPEGFTGRLEGMFAFALWDGREGELVLGRDRFGIKPLYYAALPGGLLFASEIAALLAHPEVAGEPDPVALGHWLALRYVPDPFTAFKGVRSLPPGSVLRYRPGGEVRIRRYARAALRAEAAAPTPEALREAFLEAVERHLMGDVEVGVFLSGGVDSTALLGALRQLRSGPVHTFSIGFGGHPEADERSVAARTAERHGAVHHDVAMTEDEFFGLLPDMVAHTGQPFADPSAIPLMKLSREAGRTLKVVLSGEGADEVFAGYQGYVPADLPRRGASLLPAGAARILLSLLPPGARGRTVLREESLPLEEGFLGNSALMADADAARLLKDPPGASTAALFAETHALSRGLSALRRKMAVDLGHWLPGDLLRKADAMGMAGSVEVRVPYLDDRLFSLASALGDGQLQTAAGRKLLLRRAVSPWVPPEILEAPKRGFPVPLKAWLAAPARRAWLRRLLLEEGEGVPRFFREDAVAALLRGHGRAGRDAAGILWALACFETWHRRFLGGLPRGRALAAGAAA